MSDSSYRRGSRDDLRRYSTLEVPSTSSRRGSSRDSSLRGSTHELASSYRSERYLSVQPDSLDVRREASRDGRRRNSTQETSLRRPNPSRSPRPVDTTSRYRYTPLDPKVRRAIRVIRVHHELVDDKIACEVEQVTTDSKYTALSYTWGSSKDASETIFLNGCRFMVRRNLLSFLDHARAFHAGKPLWIDAICINQEDIREKNRQVQMMSKIYSSTAEVFVWLGPRVDYAGHCLRRMQAYESMSDTEMAVSSSKDSDFWKGFSAINSARYWDRVWVIQEFIQSKHGRIIQGDRSISFDTFQNAIRRFDNRIYRLVLQYWVFGSRRNEDFSNYISNIHPLWQRRIERPKSSSVNADAKWALLSGNRFCMDIRDRVYGILPLSTHGNSLRVDYDLNPFELLLESIWLEHDTEMDRTELLMNLANILLLTPAAVCMYADHHTSSSRTHTKILHPHASQIHLRAGSSHAQEDEWLLASSHGGKNVEWRNFARDQRYRIPEGLLVFPGREQCPWQMMAYTATGGRNVGLKLAVDTSNVPGRDGKERERGGGDGGGGNGRRDRERERDRDKLELDRGDRDRDRDRDKERDRDRDRDSDHGRRERSRSQLRRHDRSRSHSNHPKVKTEPISPQDFLHHQKKRALAYGIYNTTCAPYPLRIYYSLVEGLEDMGSRSGEGAFWGLEALEDLDLDLDDLDI